MNYAFSLGIGAQWCHGSYSKSKHEQFISFASIIVSYLENITANYVNSGSGKRQTYRIQRSKYINYLIGLEIVPVLLFFATVSDHPQNSVPATVPKSFEIASTRATATCVPGFIADL